MEDAMSTEVGIEQHTTSISEEEHSPLEVELNSHYYHFERQPDDSFKRRTRYAVTLVHPGSKWIERARIINMSPRTALNLLAWLETQCETLEHLVKE